MRPLFLVLMLFFVFNVQAQDKPYNPWSVELGVGVHNSTQPFAQGYEQGSLNFPQVALGGRYMFTPEFGARLSLGYLQMEGTRENFEFNSTYLRTSLEGVANMGSLLGIINRESRVNLLLHGGVGGSRVNYDTPVLERERADNQLHLVLGITPQYRVTNRIAVFADLSGYQHLSQSYTWDGVERTEDDGAIMTASVGVIFVLGNKQRGADFYPTRSGRGGCY